MPNEQNADRGGLKVAAPRSVYYAIFAISGFSGLIYESIWSHYMKLFLGHAAYAQSLVLIIFMGGMAIGSWSASKFSARLRIPILAYAAVEAIVGVVALLFHDLFAGLIDVFHTSILPGIGSPLFGIVLIHTIFGMPVMTLLFRNFYASLPHELFNAARIDGGAFWSIFFRVMIPMSTPILIVATILQVTGIWNDFIRGLTFAGRENLPMTVQLNNIVNSTQGART